MGVSLIVGGVRVTPDAGESQALVVARDKLRKAGLRDSLFSCKIFKSSVDARHRNDVRLVYSVLAETEEDVQLPQNETLRAADIRLFNRSALQMQLTPGNEPMRARPLVVGMGPAGLFCAMLLAQAGYAPILIDRGDCVEDRVKAVETFCKTGILDPNSNIQFGAGGAGTFSDGKLLTRISDARCNYVLEQLHRFGAPDEILTQAKPHVGTDVLRSVVSAILRHIQNAGGEVRYRTALTKLRETSGGVVVTTNQGEINCGAVVLALGHSARDTYRTLIQYGLSIEPKPMSVGVRIEHLQKDIDTALYGNFAGHPALRHGEYALSDTRRDRGVYTFCMCPGGEVIPATSEEGGVVVNGMSHHARDGRNANSAVAVSVNPADYDTTKNNAALGAIEYQRKIEQAAFRAGGCDYSAPIQTVGDFLNCKAGTEPSRVLPTYRNGEYVRCADLGVILPTYVAEGLRYGIQSFDRSLRGFAVKDAVLTGVETRTSAPVRILRNEAGSALGHPNLYPCGEGAGYAGGITSAAVDGIRTAEEIIGRFSQPIVES